MSAKDTIFRFKEFEVRNCQSAMRVNTDGVLLGAWAPISEMTTQIWDVGSGTGLIALMLAQRSNANITAIEIDPISYKEMVENIRASKWANRVTPIYGDFNCVWESISRPQLIVSNPPYFTETKSGLKSIDNRRATARHEDSLNYRSLIKISSAVLPDNGVLCLISPADRASDIEFNAISSGMYVHRKTFIKTTPTKEPKRILWEITKTKTPVICDSLTIYSQATSYSEEFKQIVKNFYLNIDD